jgi:hypothetical protein
MRNLLAMTFVLVAVVHAAPLAHNECTPHKGAHAIRGLAGVSTCVCGANHACHFTGAKGFKFPCAHGTLTIGGIVHDV